MRLKELVILLSILFFALFLRIFRLNFPSEMYFDELYHVPAAMMITNGDSATPFEWWHPSYDGINNFDWLHPPLAKYFQAFSMSTLGKNPFAWRLPSLFFSLMTLILFYFFAKFLAENFLFKKRKKKERQNLSTKFSLIASFFLSIEGLFLVQSRIAMNDVFLLFFLLAAVFFYFAYLKDKNNLFLFGTGIFFGLALASKWSAIFSLLFLLLYHLKDLFFKKKDKNKRRRLPFIFFIFLFLPLFIYLLSYLPMFFSGKTFSYFFLLHKNILLSQFSNPAVHLYSSNPFLWMLNLRPVLYFSSDNMIDIYALGNPLLFLYFLLSLLYFIYFFINKFINNSYLKLRKDLSFKILFLLFALYLSNFFLWILSPRIVFFYHYLPAIPFIILLTVYLIMIFLEKIKSREKRNALFFNLLFWPFFTFIVFYPHFVALEIPLQLRESLYFLLESWR